MELLARFELATSSLLKIKRIRQSKQLLIQRLYPPKDGVVGVMINHSNIFVNIFL